MEVAVDIWRETEAFLTEVGREDVDLGLVG